MTRGPPTFLLETSLRDRIIQALERTFRLLATIYSLRQVYGAYVPFYHHLMGRASRESDLFPNAVKFLDNVFDQDIRALVMPMIDDRLEEERLRHSYRIAGTSASSAREVLAEVMTTGDAWLRACAMFAASTLGVTYLAEIAEAARHDVAGARPSLAERAAAEYAERPRQRADVGLGVESAEEEEDLNLLEKVAFLRHVEMCEEIPTEELAEIAAVAHDVRHSAREVIFRQGDNTDAVYIVAEGRVELTTEELPAEVI